MKSRFAFVLIVAAILVTGAARASAKARPSVRLDRAAIVGAHVLPAGAYTLYLPAGAEIARFIQGTRVVAEAPCRVGMAEVVYPGTAVHFRTGNDGQDRLVKIVFASSMLAVEFPADADVAARAPIETPAAPVQSVNAISDR